eukprot:1538599-Ditylum_brightwellii.AAC.1
MDWLDDTESASVIGSSRLSQKLDSELANSTDICGSECSTDKQYWRMFVRLSISTSGNPNPHT